VRPGAVRVETRGKANDIRVMAFKTPEGGLVAQVLNSGTADSGVNLRHRGKVLHLTAPAHSISTALW